LGELVADGFGGALLRPCGVLVLAKGVIGLDGADLILPANVPALNILFKLDSAKVELGKIVYELNRALIPAKLADRGNTTLTGDKRPSRVMTGGWIRPRSRIDWARLSMYFGSSSER
jgi:hypothetical protein